MLMKIKKICFALALIALVWGMIELLALAAHPALFNAAFSRTSIRKAMETTALEMPASQAAPNPIANEWTVVSEILHPYVGFMPAPETYPYDFDMGFPFGKSKNPLRKRSDDAILIAIFGGSFAEGIYGSADTLAKSLAPLNRDVIFFNFAYGGYKQPQALAELAYLLALGAQFDVVVNIDGFNEVALPMIENYRHGVAFFYPRQWHRRVQDIPDTAHLRLLGKIETIREDRLGWAVFFNQHGLWRSPFLSIAWALKDRSFKQKRAALLARLEAPATNALPFVAGGPFNPALSSNQLFHEFAQTWKRGSLQMRALCDGNGIAYFHFLQPNQYLDDSKTMSAIERKRAFDPDHPYREGVKNGYPLLRKAGEELLGQGVAFTDLTMIFKDHPEPIYIDTCCHVNRAGYDLIAARMALIMRPMLPNRLLPETSQ